jgi:hypothetical protein
VPEPEEESGKEEDTFPLAGLLLALFRGGSLLELSLCFITARSSLALARHRGEVRASSRKSSDDKALLKCCGVDLRGETRPCLMELVLLVAVAAA